MSRHALALLVALPVCALADPITATFTGTLGPLCGLPRTTVTAVYEFRNLPPTSIGSDSNSYAVDRMLTTINDIGVGNPTSAQINVGDEVDGGVRLLDRYEVSAVLNGSAGLTGIVPGLALLSVGITYENGVPKPGPNPALTSRALPLSSADLAGLAGSLQLKVGLQNLATGQFCTATSGANPVAHAFSTDPAPDAPPTADAGANVSTRVGNLVTLDGSASFDDNTTAPALRYSWSFAYRPAGSAAVLSGANTTTPSFVADVDDTYTLQLVVTDSVGQPSTPAFVEVSTNNLPPTAVAGADRLVVVGKLVLMDGSGSSDPEHDALIFTWSLLSPSGSTALMLLGEPNTPVAAMAYFKPDIEGTYLARLAVSDPFGAGTPDSATITAVLPNDYVERVVVEVAATVTGLPPAAVTSTGNQEALMSYLQQAAKASARDNTSAQMQALQRAIARTDGCALRGQSDLAGAERDWITTCAAQAEVYWPLVAALDALSPN